MSAIELAIWVLLQTSPAQIVDRDQILPIAEAVVTATADQHEQRLLMSIARWESGYARQVAQCRRSGDGGSALGIWQVHPRSGAERRELCASIGRSATIALARIRESLDACHSNQKNEQLAGYTGGSCTNTRARSASRLRWAD